MGVHGMPQRERRHFSRIPVNRCAVLDGPEGKHPVTVEDISLKGVLLELAPGATLHDSARYHLTLRLSPTAVIEMELAVAHSTGHHAGFHCRRIDLESISHLRRLIELHLGDSTLLRRELDELLVTPGRSELLPEDN